MLPSGEIAQVPIEIWRFRTGADCRMSADYLNLGKGTDDRHYVCVETSPARVAELRRAMQPDSTVASSALQDQFGRLPNRP